MSSSGNSLLILGCSQRKSASSGVCPAIDRYDGVNYRVLRKVLHERGRLPYLAVLILSAKYGLLDAQTPIEAYDQRMTHNRALALQIRVGTDLDATLSSHDYQEVFINVGKTYRLALGKSQELTRQASKVRWASGGIGEKMAEMRRWLFSLPIERLQNNGQP